MSAIWTLAATGRSSTAWADALPATRGCAIRRRCWTSAGVTRLRANRRVNGVPVVLTAAVHPF